MNLENEESGSLIASDITGFLDAENESCQEQFFSLNGREITNEFSE